MPWIATTDTRDSAAIRREMLAEMWRSLSGWQGWTRYDNAAGGEWGAQYEPTGALLIPRVTAPSVGGSRRVRDWLVCVPPVPFTYDPCGSVAEAIRSAESLPRISPAPAVPTHYDGHGAACWCDQATAAAR